MTGIKAPNALLWEELTHLSTKQRLLNPKCLFKKKSQGHVAFPAYQGEGGEPSGLQVDECEGATSASIIVCQIALLL